MALRLYVAIFIFTAVTGLVYGAKSYYDSTQATIAQLRENNVKLELANETSQNTINRMVTDQAAMQDNIMALEEDLKAAEAYKDELIGKLQKHDLSMLSLRKPGLIEKRINDGTKGVFDALEELSQPNRSSDSNPSD